MNNNSELDKLVNLIGMTRQEASVASYRSLFGKDPALEEAEKIFVALAAGMSDSAKGIAKCATELNMNGCTSFSGISGATYSGLFFDETLLFEKKLRSICPIGNEPWFVDTLSEIKIEKDLIVGKKGDRIFQQPKKFYCKGKY